MTRSTSSYTKCAAPKCKGGIRSRGLCASHHANVNKMLKAGTADEEDLMRRNLLLPKTRAGIPMDLSAFLKGSKIIGRAHRDE